MRTTIRPGYTTSFNRLSMGALCSPVSLSLSFFTPLSPSQTKHVNQLAQQNKNMDDRVTQVYLHNRDEQKVLDLFNLEFFFHLLNSISVG